MELLGTYRKMHKLSKGSLMHFHKVNSTDVTTAQMRGQYTVSTPEPPSIPSQVTLTSCSLFKKKKNSLAESRSLQDLSSLTRDWTRARQRKCRVLTTGLPGNSQSSDFYHQQIVLPNLKLHIDGIPKCMFLSGFFLSTSYLWKFFPSCCIDLSWCFFFVFC